VLAGGNGILDIGLPDVPGVFSTVAAAFDTNSCTTPHSSTRRRADSADGSSAVYAASTEEKVLLLQRVSDSDIAHSFAGVRDCRCGLVQISATTFAG